MITLKKLLHFTSLVGLFTLAANVQAATLLNQQGGDIAAGEEVYLEKYGMVSYYKDGTSGQITFYCNVKANGNGAEATLHGGKNFESSGYFWLREGMNGPYTWTLKDKGYKNGNIKVTLLKGTGAYVQCKEFI